MEFEQDPFLTLSSGINRGKFGVARKKKIIIQISSTVPRDLTPSLDNPTERLIISIFH
jgi:hypothetical protein